MQEKPKGLSGIKMRLILTMMLVCAIPLLIAVGISFVSSMTTAQKNAEEMNAKQAVIVQNEFASLIQQNIRAIEQVANSPSIRGYLENSSAYQAANQKEMVIYLQKVDQDLGDTNTTVLTRADGQQIARSEGKMVSIKDREYFQEAMKGNTNISEVITSMTTGSRIVVPAVPVYDLEGKNVIGTISRNFDISYLYEFLKEQSDSQTKLFIVGKDGVVLAHSDHEILAEDEPDDRSSHRFFTEAANQDSGTYEGMEDGKNMIVSYQKDPLTGWVVVMERDYHAVMSAALITALVIVAIGVILLVIAAIIALKMAKNFAEPVEALNETLDSMANGEFKAIGSFTERKDEFGMMVRSANSLVDRLGGIVTGIKNSARRVNKSSNELADTAGQMAKTAEDVANAVQEIATGATQQADEIQGATENTNMISENIQNVTDSADALASTAKSMSDNSRNSAEKMQELRNTTEEMRDSVDSIAEKIGATSSAVERINTMVASINSIASQTNLLALNASIEAARAGEAGKGFAVVAEEIGNLADDSANTANMIRKEMNILLEESQSAVKQAGEVRKATEDQNRVVTSAIDSIMELVNEINATVEEIRAIQGAAEACSGSKTVVVDAMSSLSAISEENAAASEETSASVQELSATVTTLATTADEMKDISDKLIEEMKFFK